MSYSTQESYEEVPYPSYTHPRTHPDRLFTIGKFFGMNPALIETCRVLELGCGDGLNLISFAYDLRDAQFVGVDLSAKHIEQGNDLIASLGMNNIRLEQKDVTLIDESFGEFDYIIAHGLYSWVPDFVRDKVMEICSRNLAPNGVAYVSYNTYPGYHMRQMLREMTFHHISQIEEPMKRITQGAAFLKFITDSTKPQTAYSEIMQSELQDISEKRPEDLIYDTLADFNQPVYFYEFIEHAEKHGLQYISEVYYSDTQGTNFTDEVRGLLAQMLPDVIRREQYIDFIRGKRFRMTLLCHKDIKLNRNHSPELLSDSLIESLATPESDNPDINTNKPEKFLGTADQQISTDNPFAKSALVILHKALPAYLSVDELFARIKEALKSLDMSKISENDLHRMLFEFYRAGLIELHTVQPRITSQLSDKPVASKLARTQIKNPPAVTALNHINIYLNDNISQHLLTLLDGTRDFDTLKTELAIWISNNEKIESKEEILKQLPVLLKGTLEKFARLALLEG